jgi:hypothetical protein
MTFQLPKPTNTSVTLVRFFYVGTTKAKQTQVMNIWQNWLPELDKRMTLVASFYNAEGEGLGIFANGFFYGSPERARKILQPFAEAVKKVDILRLKNLSQREDLCTEAIHVVSLKILQS